MMAGSPEHISLWEAINMLVSESGGRNAVSMTRMEAVAGVESALRRLLEADHARLRAELAEARKDAERYRLLEGLICEAARLGKWVTLSVSYEDWEQTILEFAPGTFQETLDLRLPTPRQPAPASCGGCFDMEAEGEVKRLSADLGQALGNVVAGYRDKDNGRCAAALVRVVEIMRGNEDEIDRLRVELADAQDQIDRLIYDLKEAGE